VLPLWTNEDGVTQYHVPEELSCLSEGEKLLIQQISVYVPLHHLKYGQLGAQGHIVSFPQDISEICKELPRLPNDVSLICVIKSFQLQDGEISSKSFMIHKEKVLAALRWLKKFNVLYADIEIIEDNMSWIENGINQQLPPTIVETILDESTNRDYGQEDRGPAEGQIASITDTAQDIEPSYGTIRQFNAHLPKVKDSQVMQSITEAEKSGKSSKNINKASMQFPYVGPDPICEYTERYLFEKAFPCLFPGGIGGYGSMKSPMPKLQEWLAKIMLYKDGQFGRDKMWAFCALNYFARHTNQTSGGFFVDTFFKQGPKNLEDLQEEVANGDMSWLSSIQYFLQCVTGSTAYWRARRTEVFSWINHHLEQKHGPPSFFITLSCAEYHWKDIERLIIDRCEKGDMNPPNFETSRASIVNEHTVVVQEYFQARVQFWLETVGKDLLKIKHHWLRYEFAPSRGQIHVHMLAICENLDMLTTCHDLKDDKEELARYLSAWVEDTLGMTATFNPKFDNELNGTSDSIHPSTVSFPK
jgi:hypothetical protein